MDGRFNQIKETQGFATGFVAYLAGVNPDRLENCPKDDWLSARRTALAMTLAFFIMVAAITSALGIAFENTPIVIRATLAAIVAGSIQCLDHAIIQSHWFERGRAYAERLGYGDQHSIKSSVGSRIATIVSRFVLSFLVSFAIAGFIDLEIYANDIENQLVRRNQSENAEVLIDARNVAAKEISNREAEAGLLQNRIANETTSGEATYQAQLTAFKNRLQELENKLLGLTKEESDLNQQVVNFQRDMVAENYNVPNGRPNSGRKGQGDWFKAALANMKIAQHRLADVTNSQNVVRQELTKLSLSPPVQPKQSAGLTLLAEQRKKAIEERDELQSSLSLRVEEIAQRDPRYVPMDRGLVRRGEALDELMKSWSVKIRVIMLFLFIMCLEMSGLLAKLFLVSPGLYSIATVSEFDSLSVRDLSKKASSQADGFEILLKANGRINAAFEQSRRDARKRRTSILADQQFEREFGDGNPNSTH